MSHYKCFENHRTATPLSERCHGVMLTGRHIVRERLSGAGVRLISEGVVKVVLDGGMPVLQVAAPALEQLLQRKSLDGIREVDQLPDPPMEIGKR